MAGEGADWIDVGGESTRPGAAVVSEEEEQERVLPVIAGLKARLPEKVRISIDTYKAGTARAAVAAGATVVNDVSGGRLDPAILGVAAETGAAIVLGHLRGAPASMMEGIAFSDVVAEVGDGARGAGRCGAPGRLPGDLGRPGHRIRQADRAQPGVAAGAAGAAGAGRRSPHGRRLAQGVHRPAHGQASGRAAVRDRGGGDGGGPGRRGGGARSRRRSDAGRLGCRGGAPP